MKQEEYKALVQAAREANLVAYFQRNGFTVERKGSEYYDSGLGNHLPCIW